MIAPASSPPTANTSFGPDPQTPDSDPTIAASNAGRHATTGIGLGSSVVPQASNEAVTHSSHARVMSAFYEAVAVQRNRRTARNHA